MKKIITILFIFIVLSFTVAAECVDDDGGSIYIKGEGDRCWDENSVFESYCYQGDSKAGKFDCPNGCKDGACLGSEPKCEDSDKGEYVDVIGTVTFTDSSGDIETKEDTCEDDYLLNEYYCETDYRGEAHLQTQGHRCATGCNEGMCNPIEGGCYDSDGGKNYQEQGHTTVDDDELGQKTYIDRCEGIAADRGDKVLEYYCSEGSLQSEIQVCDEGCAYGACKGSPEDACKDSDGGENFYERGNADTPGYMLSDHCSIFGTKKLFEATCSNGNALYVEHFCDIECNDGICLKEKPANPRKEYDHSLTTIPVECRIDASSFQNMENFALGIRLKPSERSLVTVSIHKDNNGNIGKEIFSSSNLDITNWGLGKYDMYGWFNDLYFEGYHYIKIKGMSLTDDYYWIKIKNNQPLKSAINIVIIDDKNLNTYCYEQHGIGNKAEYDITYGINIDPDASCLDTDDGKDYYTVGSAKGGNTGGNEWKDSCAPDDRGLTEVFCEGDKVENTMYYCPHGCENGACKVLELKPDVKTGPVEIPSEEIKEETQPKEVDEKIPDTTVICMGCISDNKCYPIGYRKDDTYCSDNEKFLTQGMTESTCNNNFECKSNLCIDDKCIEPGFFQKVLLWFKRLFGG